MIEKDTEKNVNNIYRNIIAEKAVVAYALRVDPLVLYDLDKDLFTLFPYRVFYDVVTAKKQIMNKNTLFAIIKVEYPTDKDEFKGFITKVFSVNLDEYSIENINELKTTLRHLYNIRRIVDGIDRVSDMIGDDRVFEVDKAISILKQATKQDSSDPDSGDIIEDFPENEKVALERIETKSGGDDLIGVPSGISALDHHTGGFMPDEFILIGGQTNIGKSIFCQCVAGHAWKHGYNVVIFSLEMRKQQVQFRIYSFLTAIEHQKFRLGTLSEDELEKWRRFYKSYLVEEENGKNYLETVYLTKEQTVEAIEHRIDKIQDKHGSKVDLVIIDYMNLLRPKHLKQGVSAKEANIQADISWDLKLLSGSLNGLGCPVITPVQLTDKARRAKVLQDVHIKYSRGTAENATAIYGLKQDDNDLLDGTMQLQFIKSRDGSKVKPIILRPNLDIMSINEEMISEDGYRDVKDM